MRQWCSALALCFTLGLPGLVAAGAARSADYSLDFALVASSGSVTSTPDYQVVQRVVTKGAPTVPATSAAYSLQPVGGVSPRAAIKDWSLY